MVVAVMETRWNASLPQRAAHVQLMHPMHPLWQALGSAAGMRAGREVLGLVPATQQPPPAS